MPRMGIEERKAKMKGRMRGMEDASELDDRIFNEFMETTSGPRLLEWRKKKLGEAIKRYKTAMEAWIEGARKEFEKYLDEWENMDLEWEKTDGNN